MRRFVLGLVVGAALGALVASLVFVTRDRPTWEEQAARAQANAFGCRFAVALRSTCPRIAYLRSIYPLVWHVRYGESHGPRARCYRLVLYWVQPKQITCADRSHA